MERLILTMDSIDGDLEKSLERMIEYKAREKSIDCSRVVKYIGNEYTQASPAQILSWVTEHEIFHDGELALYVRAANIRFPNSWVAWGLR